MQGKIKLGASVIHDFSFGKWPACKPPISEYKDEEYKHIATNPNMQFDMNWNGQYWECKAEGYGTGGKYGNGCIFVTDKTGVILEGMMKSIEELEAEYAKLEAECIMLGKVIKKKKEFPQIGDRYFNILDGRVITSTYRNDLIDSHKRSVGNFFKTEQEAQQGLDCQLVEHELRCCEGRVTSAVGISFIRADIGGMVDYYNTLKALYSSGAFSVFFSDGDYAKSAIEKVGKERILAAAKWKAERPVY